MSSCHRASALLALLLLAGCGGGGGGTSSTTTGTSSSSGAHNFSGGGANVVTLSVGNGPSVSQPTFNIPYTSVTICVPSSNQCTTINNVLVDTGSTGFRVIKSILDSAGVTLPPLADPSNAGNTIAECLPFADGYAWGAVATATIRVGDETTANAIPIQIIDDSTQPSPPVPASCSDNGGSALDSVDAFDANAVLGVGLFLQDCGPACASMPSTDVYYSCTSGGTCSPSTLAVSSQVSNPVASFATDNNGVILQLPSISPDGTVSASGYLVFGIDTESNNTLSGASIYTVDGDGDFDTTFGGSVMTGFIDSGSNALFFPDSSLPLCGQAGTGGASFFCPSSTISLTAMNEGSDNGTSSNVSFQVANLNAISPNDFAISDAGGPSSSVSGIGSNYFDWGLPFFFGNTVFVAFEGALVGGSPGPYFAY